MAVLSLSISMLTSSKTVDDAAASGVLLAVFDLYHPPEEPPMVYTNQQKLDWIVKILIPQVLTQMSRQQAERLAVAAMQAEFDESGAKFE